MGVNQKFCKVTVHRASPLPPKPEDMQQPAPAARPRRQTIATEFESNLFFQQPAPQVNTRATVRYKKTVSEIIPDEEFDAMLQSAEQTRRRAKTDASSASRMSGVEVIKGRRMNPLSRLTLRWTEQRESSKSASASPFTTDDDDDDDDLNNTIDIMDDLLDSNEYDDDDEPPLLDRHNGEFNDSFLDCDTNETDPERQTLDDAAKFFVAGTPPIPAGLTLDMLPTAHTSPSLPSNFSRNLYSSYASNASQSEDPFQSLAPMKSDPTETDDDDDDDGSSSVATSSMLDYESEEEVNIDEMRNKAEAIARFESSLQDRATPLFRTTEIPKSRQHRGMSTPPRMLSQIIRPRKQSHPVRPHSNNSPANSVEETRIALYSGQTLHLNFKTSMSQVVQVSGQPRKSSSKNIFSKRIRCQAIDDSAPIEAADALRIIGHSTDGIIQGGDCISIARNDGSVLRLQKLSKKLCFSPKIDLRAKFIVSGVPEGTIVTSKTKFYLQSVYDRSKTVGFLKSRRSSSPGYLVMYAYRSKDDKSEPIQFFKRMEQPEANSVFQEHQHPEATATRQERALQQQMAAEDLTPVSQLDDLTPLSQIILG